ncbi:hypothetical protein BJ165DRAFT_929981 [Panaeolus papilionaceus]|nr:hypothetical protein BJ165DRAFT_929981 [Panaeolus papilionaceus]
MAANSTRQISYIVKVISTDMAGGRHPDFVYQELIPANVVCPSPPEYQSKVILSALPMKHQDAIMQTRSWKCWNCEKPAVSMLHNPMSYLHKVDNPEVVDIAMGICADRGRCDVEGRQYLMEEMELAQRMFSPTSN